jgi:hypothetical protein
LAGAVVQRNVTCTYLSTFGLRKSDMQFYNVFFLRFFGEEGKKMLCHEVIKFDYLLSGFMIRFIVLLMASYKKQIQSKLFILQIIIGCVMCFVRCNNLLKFK